MEIFLPVLGWKNNWGPLFTSHIGGCPGRVHTSIHRASSWSRGHQSLENLFFWTARQNLTSLRRSKRSSIFVSEGCEMKETDIWCAKSEHNNYGNPERKIVVIYVQRQMTAISTVKAPYNTSNSIWIVSSVTCHYFRVIWGRELWNYRSSDCGLRDSRWPFRVQDIGMLLSPYI